ncbi:hypothetical protein LZ30DRAFT_216827 [Colletotrichum cereale]|nr:hypothetical protein LZ30DRAFT_216827 [Colletotrichum cereale]
MGAFPAPECCSHDPSPPPPYRVITIQEHALLRPPSTCLGGPLVSSISSIMTQLENNLQDGFVFPRHSHNPCEMPTLRFRRRVSCTFWPPSRARRPVWPIGQAPAPVYDHLVGGSLWLPLTNTAGGRGGVARRRCSLPSRFRAGCSIPSCDLIWKTPTSLTERHGLAMHLEGLWSFELLVVGSAHIVEKSREVGSFPLDHVRGNLSDVPRLSELFDTVILPRSLAHKSWARPAQTDEKSFVMICHPNIEQLYAQVQSQKSAYLVVEGSGCLSPEKAGRGDKPSVPHVLPCKLSGCCDTLRDNRVYSKHEARLQENNTPHIHHDRMVGTRLIKNRLGTAAA